MKKIVLLSVKSICVLAPLIAICFYTWKNPLAYMDGEAPYYLWNMDKTNTSQDKYYETVILGDSTANAAYIPEILSDSAINLALGGTTPAVNYYILKEWMEHNQAPKVCYISFLDMHFQAEDSFWTRTMYCHRLRTSESMEIIKAAISYEESSVAGLNYRMDFLAYELCLPNKYITALMNAGFNQRYVGNVEIQRLNEIHGGRYIARGNQEYSDSETIVYDEFSVAPFFDDYYRKLIQLCVQNNIKVHIVKLPLPDNVVFTDEYTQDFHAYYNLIKKEFPEVTIDWIPLYEKKAFADKVHMNSHGALWFSGYLKELYPEDFKDSNVSPGRAAGINDSIINEDMPEYLLGWIADKDYTLVINDGTGVFASVCKDLMGQNGYKLYQADKGKSDDKSDVYYFSGMNQRDDRFCIQHTDEGLLVMLDNQEPRLLDKPAGDIVNIAVIDHYNDAILCIKSFRYVKDDYILQ